MSEHSTINMLTTLYLNFKKICIIDDYEISFHDTQSFTDCTLKINIKSWIDNINSYNIEEFDKYIYNLIWFSEISRIILKNEQDGDEVLIFNGLYRYSIHHDNMILRFLNLPQKDLNWIRLYNLKSFL